MLLLVGWEVLLDTRQYSGAGTGHNLRREVLDDGDEEDGLLLDSGIVHLVDLSKQLLVGLVANALVDPVDSRLEQRVVLLYGIAPVITLSHGLLEDLEAKVDQHEEVVLLLRVHLVAHSSQVSGSVDSTEWLGDSSYHFGQTHEV